MNAKEFIEVPANKASISKRKKLYGIGVNDSPYMVYNKSNKSIKKCPFYQAWSHMFDRVYSDKFHKKNPTYKNCSISQEWNSFLEFKSWMINQDWKGKQLDKDILYFGNKKYGPETCIFVSGKINSLLGNNSSSMGCFPTGVYWHKRDERFISQCNVNGKSVQIGSFKTVEDAESSYCLFKSNIIKSISEEVKENKLKEALMNHSIRFHKRHLDLKKSSSEEELRNGES